MAELTYKDFGQLLEEHGLILVAEVIGNKGEKFDGKDDKVIVVRKTLKWAYEAEKEDAADEEDTETVNEEDNAKEWQDEAKNTNREDEATDGSDMQMPVVGRHPSYAWLEKF